MSGNLGFQGAYNRSKTLKPITSGPKGILEEQKSAGEVRLEREQKSLRAENEKLRREFNEINTVLKQVACESSHEKFDERRINLLKMHIIQLERQISILNEALGCRHQSILEVENTMAWLADKIRSFIAADVKGPMVPIARSDLMALVEGSESARIKLFKTIENNVRETVGKDLLFLNPFLGGKLSQGEQVSLLDISLNRMNFINLRHVAQLESKLCKLYKDLIQVHEELENVSKTSAHVGQTCSLEWHRMKTAILKTCVMGKDVADDLLSLSLLCPSSPWPPLKRPLTKDVPIDRVVASLPTVGSRQKQAEINSVLEASIGVCNHKLLLLEKEKAVLKEELSFHRATHKLQVQYTESLFEAVRKGYGEFENSAKATIIKPIKNMLGAYQDLKGSASEQALRDFLLIVKDHEEQLSSIVDLFETQSFEADETGAAAFSRFGAEFFNQLDALVAQCQVERDQLMQAKRDLADQHREKDLELQRLIEDLEAKYNKQWKPLSKPPSLVKKREDVSVESGGEISRSASGQSVLQSETSTRDKTIQSSNRSEKKHAGDDPTMLRSYLYTDNTAESDTSQCRLESRHENISSCDRSEEQIGTCEVSEKGNKKLGRKATKWKPEREWVSDFSSPTDTQRGQEQSISENSGMGLRLNLNQRERVGETNPTTPVSSKDKADFDEDSLCQNAAMSKAKKPPRTYEPCLIVPNRTLKLRRGRGGMLDNEASVNQNTSEKACVNDMIVSDKEEQPPEASKDPKDITSLKRRNTNQKRSSWR